MMAVMKPGEMWVEDYRYPGYFVEPNGRVASTRGKEAKVLKPIKRGKYLGFTLADQSGKLRPVYLHRLVAENFYGPPPEGMECCHNDGDRLNNSLWNLRWDTHAANEADKVVRNVPCKLTSEQVRQMRQMREETGKSYKIIASHFGITTMTAFRAITKQTWAEVQ
jgi:hypothetical protein